MKKTILAMLLAGCSCAVFAQNDSLNTMGSNNSNNSTSSNSSMSSNTSTSSDNSLSNNSSYNAYSTFTAIPPDYVSSYVLRDYPTATDVRWQQAEDWWHGYYLTGNQPMNVYYNTAGTSFTVALPVRQTLIPDAVVSKAVSMYGPTLYDINTIKGSNRQDVYVVRTLQNGQLSSQYIDENGTAVTDIYRVDIVDPMMMNNNAALSNNSNMSTTTSNLSSEDANTGKMKIKTKDSDGHKTKTKIVDGKIKKSEQ
jgi:hypothetical protein